ncbi:MAG: hypothetical protein J7K36_07305, partial [Archaeoglobaceae archaeon]|nr:hypothetical protein [Archaeoglobaceae archaeon]
MDEQFVSQLIINKINKVAFLTHQVENYLKEETKKKEGRTIFRKILEVLKENELIDYTITTGRLAAYEILSEDVDLDEFSEPIVFVDYFKDSPVFIVDFNSPYVPIKSEVESLIKSLEKEEMIRRIKYRWKFYKYKNENGEVRYLSIDIPENKILKREMIYLTVKDSLDIKNVSLAK